MVSESLSEMINYIQEKMKRVRNQKNKEGLFKSAEMKRNAETKRFDDLTLYLH